MECKFLLLLLILTLHASAEGQPPDKVSLSEKNAPLKTVLKKIKRQTSYSYSFRSELIQRANTVTIQVENMALYDALDRIFQTQPLSYNISGKMIVIKEKQGVSLNTAPTTKEFIDVHGRVLNESGDAASGVTVTVKGSEIATATNENGEFFLPSVSNNAVLVFSGVNIEKFEVELQGRTELSINLKTKVTALENVVVAYHTGYEKIPKERATGSFQNVSNEELNRKVGPDILSRLEGVTTGILFDRRGFSPNRGDIDPANIQVRGLSTLTRTMTSPLIVLNNFPYEGDINNINPNDIENISILKDAAASSIWGAKAANGVIVITTKDGAYNKKPQVTVNTNFNHIQQPDLFHYKKMSSSEFIDVESYLFERGFFNSNINNTTTFPALTPVVDILARRRANQITAADSALQIDALRNTDLRDDFTRYFYRSATSQQYSLNVSGGSQTVKYAMSGGFDKTPDVLVGNERTRITFFSNTSFQLTKKLTATIAINHASISAATNAIGNIGSSAYNYRSGRLLYPYARLDDDQGIPLATVKDYRAAYTDTAGGGRLLDWKYRPLDELNNADNTQKQQETLLNLGLNCKLSNSVLLQTNYQFQFANDDFRKYYSEKTYFTRNLVNLYSRIQGNNVTRIIPANGILDLNNNQSTGHNGRVQLNYNRVLSEKHELAGLAGGEIRERIISGFSDRTYGYNNNILGASQMDFVTDYTLYGGNRGIAKVPFVKEVRKLNDRFVSVFGNLSYTYDKRYTVSLSGRRDASNLFGTTTNDKWKPFWTVGWAWNIANEKFYKESTLTNLKLRGSFGYVGNVNNSIAPYTIINYASSGSALNGLPYASIGVPANPGLTWETVRELNLGLAFGFAENRISGSFEFYRKKSNDLILLALNDPTSGVNNVNKNSASMAGTGYEAYVKSINVGGKSFRWVSEFGFSKVTNNVLDYKQDDRGVTVELTAKSKGLSITRLRDKSPYPIFSFPFAGLDASGNPQGYDGKTVTTDYQKIFNQKLDTGNIIYHGSATPTVFGFLNNIISYKGLSLLININYSFGYYFKKSTISYFDLYNSGIGHVDYSKRWQQTGDESLTTVPSLTYPLSNSRRDDFYANSEVNVLKGDNIRLQSIRASFTLGKQLSQKLSVENLQVYSALTNIGIIWRANEQGLDPDIDAGNAPYPRLRTMAFGLTATF